MISFPGKVRQVGLYIGQQFLRQFGKQKTLAVVFVFQDQQNAAKKAIIVDFREFGNAKSSLRLGWFLHQPDDPFVA